MATVLNVTHLTKSYGKLTVLHDFNLHLSEGETFGLLGANGAGKSTTIECILGTKKADSGNVTILGLNPHTQRKQLFEKVSVQFQEANYQDLIQVGELCELTASLYKSPLDYHVLLAQFALAEKIKAPIKDLSGGEKQKLFIILALIPSPKIVFLDELTTGLDTRARRDIWHSLNGLKSNGLSIFLTSHYMDEVAVLCDHISILKKGETIFYGTVQDAISQSPYPNLEDAYLWYTDQEVPSYENI